MNKQKAKQQIQKLVEKYQRIAAEGKIKSYNEAQTRNEFIEPLFEFLGWDMRNLFTDNEVTTEENVSGGRVDLAFRFNNIPVMFLEAKAMKVDLDDWKWAEQAINYSWNKSVTWAVLTDFEGIKIFNAEIPPKSISQNLFIEINWWDFINRFDQLWLLSKESFEQKFLDKEAEKWGKLTQRKQVGEKLFEDLMSWRVLLTRDFKKQNTLNDEELNEGVQRILDRLIFIRTAEDRKIEPNVLLSILRSGKPHLYKQLVKVFRDFDDGFNSKLFALHYCEEWKVNDKIISEVIKGLYKTKNGYRYDFSAIFADVLGGIYEQYLSFVQGRKGEDKSKSKRKSQGIYYTPKYIVEFIVKETLGEVLKKTKPKDISKIKVLDPACGSGSFLTAAYDKILETLTKQNPQISFFTKFDILKENIFGVDLDAQAVEIAQLNLLLKVLSQKTKLPTLQHNLNSGNSLVSGNAEKLEKYFGEKWREQKPFDFQVEFKEVFSDKYSLTVDTNSIEISQKNESKENEAIETIKNLANIGILELYYSSVTEREMNQQINLLKKDLEVGVYDESTWNNCVYGGDDDGLENILTTITSCSFPKRGQRNNLSSAQKRQLRDAMIFEGHVRNKREVFITLDKKAFIGNKGQNRDKLERFFNTKIFTPSEFVKNIGNIGFDVIIGNPPYIKEDTNRSAFDGLHDNPYYQGKMDIWTLFACRAIDLLKDGGYFSFIAPSSWVGSAGASIFRQKILSSGEIIKFVDFNDFRVFKDASIQTMIFVFQKKKPRKSYKVRYAKITSKDAENEAIAKLLASGLNKQVENSDVYEAVINPLDIGSKSISFLNDTIAGILGKVEKVGNFKLSKDDIGNGIDVLQDFVSERHLAKLKDDTIKKGDGVFVLDNSFVEKMKLNNAEREYLKPYYTTSQINRYLSQQNNEYKIIYADKYFREHIGEFPNLKAHIDCFKKILTSAFAPYGLHRPREERFFKGKAIFLLRKTMYPAFTCVAFPCYVTRAFLVLKPEKINLKYLTALLNSKLIYFWLKHKGKKQGEQLQIDKEPLMDIPLFKTSKKEQEDIATMVDAIMARNAEFHKISGNTDKWHSLKVEIAKVEQKIDKKVYKIYELDSEDIKTIKNE